MSTPAKEESVDMEKVKMLVGGNFKAYIEDNILNVYLVINYIANGR